MNVDALIGWAHTVGGITLIWLALRYALRVEQQDAELDRLRRRVALYQADAHDQQAVLRRAFESECG